MLLVLRLSLPLVPLKPTDFTLSNVRRYYSSMGKPLGVKGYLTDIESFEILA